jgi:hypothetical protein
MCLEGSYFNSIQSKFTGYYGNIKSRLAVVVKYNSALKGVSVKGMKVESLFIYEVKEQHVWTQSGLLTSLEHVRSHSLAFLFHLALFPFFLTLLQANFTSEPLREQTETFQHPLLHFVMRNRPLQRT